MNFFINRKIDLKGGFSEAGVSHEESKRRLEKARVIYASSCGSPVPNIMKQEILETAWLLHHTPGVKLFVDHYYSGSIGKYGYFKEGISSEIDDVLDFSVAQDYKSFMMQENYKKITSLRNEQILSLQKGLGLKQDISRVSYITEPPKNVSLENLISGAKENEAILTFLCPIMSTQKNKEVYFSVRKDSNSTRGWKITHQRSVTEVSINERIINMIATQSLADLQRLLGISLNGKAYYRMLFQIMGKNDYLCMRDYSNARGTVKQAADSFGGKLILTKRMYVNKELSSGFTEVSDRNFILETPPVSNGETVIMHTVGFKI